MKRILSMLCALVLLLSLCACGKGDNGASESTEPQEIPTDASMLDAILAWDEVDRWEIAFSSITTMIDDGNEDEMQGSALSFEGKCIPAEAGNLYYGSYVGVNSALAFELTYDYYYYDGWTYEIYVDPYGVEELSEHYRYESTEEDFLATFDGIEPILITEEDFKNATAHRASDGTVMVSVPVTDPKTMNALTGDISSLAAHNKVDAAEVELTDAVISYSIKDGALNAYIGTYTLTMDVDGVERVFTMEKSGSISAVGDAVESVTLPEDAQSYEIIELDE